MKWKLVSCVILLACLILQVAPVMAAGTTVITGTVPLVTYEISASNIGYYSATIAWKTNGNATSQVFYDTVSHASVAGYPYHTDENTSLVSNHSIALTGLSSSTTYHYRVRSVIPGTEFIAISQDYTFTTLAPPSGGGPPSPPPPPAPVVVAPGIVDISKVVTTEGVFTQAVSAKSEDAKVEVAIPKDTIGKTKEGTPLSQISVTPMTAPPTPPAQSNVIGLTCDLGPDGATFSPPIAITFTYDSTQIPTGVNEKDLVIAYYDKGTAKWVELECVVDTQTNTISAKVSHFTAFVVLGYKAAPPVAPAAFTVSGLSVLPGQVYAGDKVSIVVIVANTGGKAGSYSVTLKINDVVEATQEITVSTGRSKEATFTTARDIPGTYAVTVDGLSGSFTVVQPPPPPPALAAFTVSDLAISPTKVDIGESVSISFIITNTGDLTGSHEATIKIDGAVIFTKEFTIPGGATQKVTFVTFTTFKSAGTYTVNVNGLSGTFVVKAPPVVLVKPPINWPLIGGIIAAVIVVGLLIFFPLRMRRRAA